MLGSVGGLVEVISKVVDNVVASDAEVVLKTVKGYVTRSLMRFIYLFNFLPQKRMRMVHLVQNRLNAFYNVPQVSESVFSSPLSDA